MTLMEGLSAANLALGLLKDLRDIDRSVDEASFKLKIAEITSALAEAKIALSDANISLNEKNLEIGKLRSDLEEARSGERCPKCHEGRLQLVSTEPKRQYGLNHYGVEEWHYVCCNAQCGFEQERLHDPHNVLQKAAAGKLR